MHLFEPRRFFLRHRAVIRTAFAVHAAALSLVAVCGSVAAGSPRVDGFEPAGVQRGHEVEIKLRGTGLQDVTGVLVQNPKIELLSIEAKDNANATAKFRCAEDMAPGLYSLWFVTRSGVSNMRLLSVGTLPTIGETEPNSVPETAQPVEMNTTVEGVVDREDLDHYSVELKAGQKLNVEIEGLRLHFTLNNQNILDPYIAVLDEKQFELASSDDASMWQQDGFVSFTAPADGKYFIQVRDSAFGGNPRARYRLHIGDFPRPMAIVPAGGPPGSLLEAELLDVEGNSTPATLQLPSETDPAYPVITETESGVTPSPNFIRVVDMPLVAEAEPNEKMDAAPPVAAPAALCGVLAQDKDIDYFTLDAKKGKKYRVEVYARRILRSKVDAVLNVYGPDKKRIGGADDTGSPDPYFEFTAAADGPHYIRINDHLTSGGPLHYYRIEVTEAKPQVVGTPKELRRDEIFNSIVPQGGHGVMIVSAKRKDYGGEITFDAAELPEGVTTTTWPIPKGRSEIPIVFHAKPEASLGGNFLRLASGQDAYEFSFEQTHKLVLGQNRRALWTKDTDHNVLVVAEPNPFRLTVHQPKTAIVRQGNKDIRVTIERNEGFTNPVSLRTAYNPPGIGVNNSRKFEKDATEITIPITANGGAATGKWPLVFVLRYGGATGAIEVASNPIELNVETQYFKFEFPKSTGELGTESSVTVKTEVLRDLPAEAEVELVGLPKGVTSSQPVQTLAKDTSSVTFPISIAADAKPGSHKTLVCIGRVKVSDEPIVQTVGTGELRVDKPLPPKKDAPKANQPAKPAPAPAKDKPLSRLEKLRQEANGK